MGRFALTGCFFVLFSALFTLQGVAGCSPDDRCAAVGRPGAVRQTGMPFFMAGAAAGDAARSSVQAAPSAADGLSAGVVYIVEDEGWRRLLSSDLNRDYFLLNSYVESERFLTFCSIASMAAVLNSLDLARPLDPTRYPYPYFTQDNIFILANERVKSFEEVVTDGLTLAEIDRFLGNLGVAARPIYADETGVDAMREAIREALAARNARVIVNYDRSVLGQRGAGHVSPIGAYDTASDSVLVLDVARYKYPPAWVPMKLIHRAMRAVDGGSGRSRGIAVVRTRE